MISTSIGSTTALAATAPLLEKDEAEEENPNFVLDQVELSEALLKAIKDVYKRQIESRRFLSCVIKPPVRYP